MQTDRESLSRRGRNRPAECQQPWLLRKLPSYQHPSRNAKGQTLQTARQVLLPRSPCPTTAQKVLSLYNLLVEFIVLFYHSLRRVAFCIQLQTSLTQLIILAF